MNCEREGADVVGVKVGGRDALQKNAIEET